ncbi:MAG: hypothetical protein ACFWUE_06195 [Xylanivirga thermophila]|jgi:type I restriction enzyme, S subunit|uniref:restriction endonuclease subunit S n=1 Tax=Xylanivirga thermophila TaxID=2496273 RepID=UPI0039F4A967
MVSGAYRETKIGILPAEWEVVSLDEVALDMADGPFGSNLKKIHYTEKQEVRIIQLSNIGESGWKDENKKYTTFEHAKTISRSVVSPGNAVVAKMMPAGRTIICPDKDPMYILSSDAVKIIFNEHLLLTKFFVYITKTKIFQKQISDEIQGSTRVRTSISKLKKNYVFLPPIQEQKTIIDVISDVEELIRNIEKLMEKKKAIKQGAMQELLTGSKRLIKSTKQWEKVLLGDIVAHIRKGDTLNSSNYELGTVPVIAGGKEAAGYHSKSNRGKNTITISASGANAGYIGFHKQAIFATDCSTIEEDKNYNVRFIYYLLLLKQELVYKLQTGGAQPHVYPRDLEEIEFYYTESLEEQDAIVQILSDMDMEIEQLQEKLNKYQKIKQGMMDELLTGKTRLI